MRLVSGVGFSNGCAELALKKPPPLVPELLDDLLRGDRPLGDHLRGAFEGRDLRRGVEVLDDALRDEHERADDARSAAARRGSCA